MTFSLAGIFYDQNPMTKIVLLAGGLGTRLSEETELRPKPMVQVGEYPILWHIMKYFACFDFKDFYVALGYKEEVIKEYFASYHQTFGSMMVNLATGQTVNFSRPPEDWRVHLVSTGLSTQTGGRVKRVREYVSDGEPFIVTYGDGLADINVRALLDFHKSHGRLATVTAVRPPARFGAINFDGDRVESFSEKPQAGEGWINGGFLVFNPGIFDYLTQDSDSLEREGLEKIAEQGELMAYRHDGFWQCMDTQRDKYYLESLWQSGGAPWKIWEDPVLRKN